MGTARVYTQVPRTIGDCDRVQSIPTTSSTMVDQKGPDPEAVASSTQR